MNVRVIGAFVEKLPSTCVPGWLNFLVLQWFGIRLARVFAPMSTSGRKLTLEDVAVRERFELVPTGWTVIRWVWPLTGWWTRFRWIRRST